MYRVVVADDEFLEREFIKEIIRGMCGTDIVGESNNGIAAVDLCSVLRPDLVFLNCGMGTMCGAEAAYRIRQADMDIVIVLTSAEEENFHSKEQEPNGVSCASEYLLKPIRAEKIKEVVLKYEGRGKPGARVQPRLKKRLKFYPANIMSKEITQALDYIETHYRENVNLEVLAIKVSLSRHYFSKLFKKEVGMNFSQYILEKRLKEAKRMLGETDCSIADISVTVGFQEHNYFGRVFKRFAGFTPSEYRKKCVLLKKERDNVRERYL
ncbi:MAG: helix-turn-helix domain-containing protein [Synergistaceae bacterium]|jgi:YesN/AraC family two-component response regulator|nr:helix-turn-helix domain-containing protein [Synergistaceae bacterium]